jgi:hypothetical protein
MAKKLDPELVEATMLSAGYKPLEPYVNALAKWKCLHINCGEIVTVKYNSIQQGKGGCISCGLKKSAKSRTFSEEKAIAIMMEKNLRPLEEYRGTIKGWKCECLRCGKIVYPALAAVQRSISGCAYCSGKRVDPEEVVAKMLESGYIPLEPYTNALKKWKCKCAYCGKESSPTYHSVAKGSSCVYCANRKVDELSVIEIMKNSYLEPLEPYSGNKTPWKSKCLKCSRIVYPRWNDVQKGHTGCNYCAPKGINLTKSSYLYLITHHELNAHKVGIGNHKKVNDRLGRFRKFGWETYRVWEFETGKEALDIEEDVFKILRGEMSLPVYLSLDDMKKTQGHTETVGADSITLVELERIIKRVIKEKKHDKV